MFLRNISILVLTLFSSNLFALVKIESIKQSGIQGRGSVRVYLSSSYNIKNVELMYGDDYAEILVPDSFIIPATKKIFKPSSASSSVLRMEAELLNGTKVSIKIFFKSSIELIKKTAELKQLGKDIVFYYSTKAEPEETVTSNIVEKEEETKLDIKAESNVENKINIPSDVVATETQNIVTKKELKNVNEFSFFWSFVKMIVVLIFLIAIFILAAYLAKKYLKTPISLYGRVLNDPLIKIENKLGLELGKNLYIIKVEGERHLIGASKEAITYLCKLKETPVVASSFEEKVQKNSLLLANSEDKVEQEEKLKSRLKDRIKDKKNI